MYLFKNKGQTTEAVVVTVDSEVAANSIRAEEAKISDRSKSDPHAKFNTNVSTAISFTITSCPSTTFRHGLLTSQANSPSAFIGSTEMQSLDVQLRNFSI